MVSRTAKSTIRQVSISFCWLSQGLVVWPRLSDPFVSQNPRELCTSHFPRRILGFAYTIYSYGYIYISCTVDHFPHRVMSSLILFLHKITAFAYHVIDRFISITTLLLLFTPWEFFTRVLADGLSLEFEWQQVSSSLQDSSQYSWMISTRLPTSKSPSHFNHRLVTVPKTPITIVMIVTFIFYNFSNSLARLRYLYFFLLSLSFILWSAVTAKSTIFLFLSILRCSLMVEIKWSFVCQSHIGVYVCHSLGQMQSWAYSICSYGQI